MGDSSSSSSSWYRISVKLRFFSRIWRFVHKTSTSNNPFCDRRTVDLIVDQGERMESINHVDDEDDNGILQRSVKGLHFGCPEEKADAAKEIKRLAGYDLRLRKLMADLGVIQPLVAMVSVENTVAHRRLAVQTLLELANGTSTNKALMVAAGILQKLSENIGAENLPKYEFAQLLMSLSSLVNAQFYIESSKVLPLVLHVLESEDSNINTKMFCLTTLYNLSTVIDNVGSLTTNEVIHTLLKFSSNKEASEKALATLGNLVVTSMGKKALESNPIVPECLIDILTWDGSKSQELSAYVLMIIAHQSYVQRTKMVEGGIVPILLQVALLGTPLAQKRALKLLQWFKDERQMKMGPHSGPQSRRLSFGSSMNQEDTGKGKELMKKMVQQSLYKNMETITRRANGDSDHSSSKFKLLVISSSSKSLPY